ncbi:MAG: hypothetical protein LBK05_06060 [Treponema sp.]|nr:hypothetical protein [Treponema sp.]
MKYLFVFAVVSLLGLILPAAVFAHGVEVSGETGRPDVRTVRFMYTDGESMLFAKVKVFAPSSPAAAAQESIADRYGYFSFIPFEDGGWRLTAEDGMGHKGEIFITVAGGAAAETAGEGGAAGGTSGGTPGRAGNGASLPLRLVLGISLILNIFAFYSFVLAGFLKRRGGHAYQ